MNRKRDLRRSAFATLLFIGLLWWIGALDTMFNLELVRLGVFPRQAEGLKGIVFAPLIHGSWQHLFANTLPLFVLCTTMLYGYPESSRIALPLIYLLSGLGVWLFARESFHIGSSGLTHGIMFFLFIIGILRRDRLAIVISMIVFFLYGGMIWGIFPQKPGVSFEYHFFGAAAGAALAFLLRNRDPALPEKKYEWEDETDGEDDAYWKREDDETNYPGN